MKVSEDVAEQSVSPSRQTKAMILQLDLCGQSHIPLQSPKLRLIETHLALVLQVCMDGSSTSFLWIS